MASPAPHYFFTLSHKRYDIRKEEKKATEHKMCVSFSSKMFSETFLIPRSTEKDMIENTECNRSNGPDFGRVFLMLNYTEKPQNTYIQSWTVSEIMASEDWNFDSYYSLIDY